MASEITETSGNLIADACLPLKPTMDKGSSVSPKRNTKNSVCADEGGFAADGRQERSGNQTHVLHSQVMRIREEDQHLGEDIRQGLNPKDRIAILQITSQMKDMFFSYSRPTFPSPLGMKARVRSI